MAPRIFISHVNNDPSGDKVWPAIRNRLIGDGFDVLVDRDLLRPGDQWRNEIYSWMHLCDAAVVLISREALDNPSRYWVARELACLIYRRHYDRSLRVIPVLLDDVTFQDLEATERFRDLQIAEAQCVFGGDVAKVAGALNGFRGPDSPWVFKLAGRIFALLSGFTPTQIEGALRQIDVDLGSWAAREDPHRHLALSMLTMNVQILPRVISELIDLDPDRRNTGTLSKIAELLLPRAIDMDAVRAVVEEGLKAKDGRRDRRALLLNAPEERFAERYAQRAFPDAQSSLTLLKLTAVFGEANGAADVQRQLTGEIEAAIAQTIQVEEDTRDERIELCQSMVKDGRPVIVTAKLGNPSEAALRQVMKDYGFATFLFRSEVDAPTGSWACEVVTPLEPKLSSEQHKSLRTLFNDVKNCLSRAAPRN